MVRKERNSEPATDIWCEKHNCKGLNPSSLTMWWDLPHY